MTDVRRPAPDLYSAGQPTPGDLSALARAGVRTVINLRAPSESVEYDEAGEAQRLGLRYVSLPIAGSQDLVPETIQRFSRELTQARALGPVLVHCGTANRAGALIALDEGLVKGAPRDSALALGREAGLASLEPAVEAVLSSRGA